MQNIEQIGDDLLVSTLNNLRQRPGSARTVMVRQLSRQQPLSKNLDGLGRLMAEIAKSNGGILANHGIGVIELHNQVCDQVGCSIR